MLTIEDSKRVSDALLAKIENTDIDLSVTHVLREFLVPSRNDWHDDWLPQIISDSLRQLVCIASERAHRD